MAAPAPNRISSGIFELWRDDSENPALFLLFSSCGCDTMGTSATFFLPGRRFEMNRGNLSRRGFLQRSLAALSVAGVPTWYAQQLLAARENEANRKASANDTLTMGIVGIGSPISRSLQVVGESDSCVKSKQLTFVAGCDVDRRHRERATAEMR